MSSDTPTRVRWGTAAEGVGARRVHLYATVHGFTAAACGRITKGIRVPDEMTVDSQVCRDCANLLTGLISAVSKASDA